MLINIHMKFLRFNNPKSILIIYVLLSLHTQINKLNTKYGLKALL